MFNSPPLLRQNVIKAKYFVFLTITSNPEVACFYKTILSQFFLLKTYIYSLFVISIQSVCLREVEGLVMSAWSPYKRTNIKSRSKSIQIIFIYIPLDHNSNPTQPILANNMRNIAQ